MNVSGLVQNFKPMDFQFLVDIAKLVHVARRSVGYTMVTRFYLKGRAKAKYFDFMQQELIGSLEKLTAFIETTQVDQLTEVENNRVIFGRKFHEYKERGLALQSVCSKHFNGTLQTLASGLEHIEENSDDDPEDMSYFNTGRWKCAVCTLDNEDDVFICGCCDAPKPDTGHKSNKNKAGGVKIGGMEKKSAIGKGKKGKK